MLHFVALDVALVGSWGVLTIHVESYEFLVVLLGRGDTCWPASLRGFVQECIFAVPSRHKFLLGITGNAQESLGILYKYYNW